MVKPSIMAEMNNMAYIIYIVGVRERKREREGERMNEKRE
jgi:hypothetical protein